MSVAGAMAGTLFKIAPGPAPPAEVFSARRRCAKEQIREPAGHGEHDDGQPIEKETSDP